MAKQVKIRATRMNFVLDIMNVKHILTRVAVSDLRANAECK